MPDHDPPPGMPPDQQQIWRDTITELLAAGTIARLDLNALHAYTAAVSNHRQATTLIAASGILLDRDGQPVPNPALATQTQAAQVIATFGKQFGLTRHQAAPSVMEAARDMEPDRPPGELGRWCEPHHRWECTKNKHGGVPCHKVRIHGTPACNFHKGPKGDVQRAAAALVRVPTFGQPVDVSPGEALLQEVRRTAGIVGWLGQIVGDLAPGDVVWGVEKRADHTGGDWPGSDVISTAKPSVWVSLYQAERRHLVATCEAALRANVDERLVRLAEMQGGRIVAALNGIFEDIALTEAQRAMLPEVVPRRIRELVA